MTVADLILRSLQDLNIVGGGGDLPDPNDVQLAFERLNDWIDDLKNDGLVIYTITRQTWTLVNGTATYTVGSGATVNIDRPVGPNAISNIGFQDTSVSPTYERLIGPVLTEDMYAAIPFKALTSVYPAAFYYNPTLPTGTLKPFPIPTSTTLQGVIYAPAPLAEFAALTDTVTFAPGFRRFVRNALTVELASAFEKTPPQTVVQAMTDSRTKIKRVNERLVDLTFDAALVHGRSSNIYTGP